MATRHNQLKNHHNDRGRKLQQSHCSGKAVAAQKGAAERAEAKGAKEHRGSGGCTDGQRTIKCGSAAEEGNHLGKLRSHTYRVTRLAMAAPGPPAALPAACRRWPG